MALIGAVVAGTLAGPASADVQPDRLIALAEPIIANQMRDPESARFLGVYVVTEPTPARKPPKPPPAATVCGWVNAKNGYGGYAHPSRFYAVYGWKDGAIDDTQVSYKLEQGDEEAQSDAVLDAIAQEAFFQSDWRQYCLDATHAADAGPDESVLPTPAMALPRPTSESPGAPPASAGLPPVRLGVVFLDLPADAAAALHRPDLSGAWIMSVLPGSVAQKADLRAGDVVTAVEGKPVHGRDDLVRAVAAVEAGRAVAIRVARGAENLDLTAQF